MKRPPPESEEIAAFLRGALFGFLSGNNVPGLAVADVELERDERGDYRDYMTVITKSGLRIRVRVTPE